MMSPSIQAVESTEFEEVNKLYEDLRNKAHSHLDALDSIETSLSLEKGFINSLIDEPNDWAFIIKTTVIIEAVLGELLKKSLINDLLDSHISHLNMGGRTGKIKLAIDLKLITSSCGKRLNALSEIRNDFAHGLDVVQLSINQYVLGMNNEEFERFFNGLFSFENKKSKYSFGKKDFSVDGSSDDERFGKYLIWASTCVTLFELAQAHKKIDAEFGWRNALMELGHAFLNRQKGNERNARAHIKSAMEMLEKVTGKSEPT